MVIFFFNDTATTEIYTLSLHDALPIYMEAISELHCTVIRALARTEWYRNDDRSKLRSDRRSEEHTSELQSPVPISYAVFCLKKKKKKKKKSDQGVFRTTHNKDI